MTHILLVGSDAPLLEGLAQSLAAFEHTPRVALSMHDGRELAAQNPPLIAVVARDIAADSLAELFGLPLAPGGALVLYRTINTPVSPLPPALMRGVLADLMLPLERNRLAALVASVEQRAVGRGRSRGGSDEHAETP